MTALPWLLLACLEPVTGEQVPLDPRFTAGSVERQVAGHQPMPPGAPGGEPFGPGHLRDPFAGFDGPTVRITGEISADEGTSLTRGVVVDLGVFRPDRSASGRTLLGRVEVGLGAYTIEVPAGIGALALEALVDLDDDGPTGGDPTGRPSPATLEVGSTDLTGVDIVLTVHPGDAPPRPGEDGTLPR